MKPRCDESRSGAFVFDGMPVGAAHEPPLLLKRVGVVFFEGWENEEEPYGYGDPSDEGCSAKSCFKDKVFVIVA